MKILVIHATAGAGHMKAAEAIHAGFKKHTNHDVTLLDALDYTNPFFEKTYPKGYEYLVTYVPWLWGFFFALLDIPFMQPFVRLVRRIYNGFNAKKLERYLIDQKYDAIISTQFLSLEIASHLKMRGLISSKLYACVTDYDVHRIWLGAGVDQYFVASDWTKEKLRYLGVEQDKVTVTGIPSHEKFSELIDRVELKQKLGLRENIFTVLIATGSFGFGPIEDIVKKLDGFQVLVICGHNKNLYARLTQNHGELVKVYGFVDNMHELMAVSDAMVTKPGGLSITEALVRQLPMLFFRAIPGQEQNNVEVLKYYGIGISDVSLDRMVEYLRDLQSSRDKFLTVLAKTKVLARPSAVQDIIQFVQ